MKSRCLNPNNTRFAEWGGIGVTIYGPWIHDFGVFLSAIGECPSPSHSLDRYPNPNGNYEPGNVRWATRSEQQRNRRDSRKLTFKDRTQSIYDWADETGLPVYIIRNRMNGGWSPEKVLSTPVRKEFARTGRLISYRGQTKSVSQWARELNIKPVTLHWRLNQNWPIEKAFKQRL